MFQKKLSGLHNRLAKFAEEEAEYVLSSGLSFLCPIVPIHMPGEMGTDVAIRTERQLFYIRVQDLCCKGEFILPTKGDRIRWRGDLFRVVSPYTETTPKSNASWFDYTTSARDVIKVETVRDIKRSFL